MERILYSPSGVMVRLRAGIQPEVTASPILTVRITMAPRPPAAASDDADIHFMPHFSRMLHETSWARQAQHMIHSVAGGPIHRQDLRFLVRTFCDYSRDALQSFLMRGGDDGGFLSLSMWVQIPDTSTVAVGPNNPPPRPHLPNAVAGLVRANLPTDSTIQHDGGVEVLLPEEEDAVDVGNKAASASAARRLKRVVFSEVNGGCRETSCSVCIENFASTSVLSVMPCGHGFHSSYLEEWLKRSHLCPLCRLSL